MAHSPKNQTPTFAQQDLSGRTEPPFIRHQPQVAPAFLTTAHHQSVGWVLNPVPFFLGAWTHDLLSGAAFVAGYS